MAQQVESKNRANPASLQSLPIGLYGTAYQMVDLHGEGIPGILTEQAGAWFYQRNISPIGAPPVEFAPLECVGAKPNATRGGQFLDLAGDGHLDLVDFNEPTAGFYERPDEGWLPLRPFIARPNSDCATPTCRLVDLTGDGHADLLITEDDASFVGTLRWQKTASPTASESARTRRRNRPPPRLRRRNRIHPPCRHVR